jgi:H+-translocating NAD(P) transhydrogenase subunit alpha
MISMRSSILLVIGALVVLATVTAPAQQQDLKVDPIHGPSASTGSAARTDTTIEPDRPPVLTDTTPAVHDAATIPLVAEEDKRDFSRYDALLTGLTVFALAVFVGFEVISKVPTTLHTPLMSGSNAISGITAVGAIIIGGHALYSFSSFLGFLAISLAMINVVGGFLVTHRMLSMFKRK